MSEKIHFILPMPPSANRYWRTTVIKGRAMTFVSDEAKKYRKAVQEIADLPTLIYSEIAVSLKVYRPQRSGDLDNKLKCLIDALKGVTYADDKQIVELHAFRYEDKHNPRVEVEIQVLGLC